MREIEHRAILAHIRNLGDVDIPEHPLLRVQFPRRDNAVCRESRGRAGR